jgi:hypothetical protein
VLGDALPPPGSPDTREPDGAWMNLARGFSAAAVHPDQVCLCCNVGARRLGNEYHNKRICIECEFEAVEGEETDPIPKDAPAWRARVQHQQGTIPYELYLCDAHHLAVRAAQGWLSGIRVFPMKTHFVWGFCMGA